MSGAQTGVILAPPSYFSDITNALLYSGMRNAYKNGLQALLRHSREVARFFAVVNALFS